MGMTPERKEEAWDIARFGRMCSEFHEWQRVLPEALITIEALEKENAALKSDVCIELLKSAIKLQNTHYGHGTNLHIAMVSWEKRARAELEKIGAL